MDRHAEKRQKLLELLGRGMVMVHLDARREGVRVPPAHADNHALALNLSYRFHLPDFQVDEHGVQASLSFNRQRFPCVLPWSAIFALRSHTDDSFHVWPGDVPSELLDRARRFAAEAASTHVEQNDTDALPGLEEGPVGRPTGVPYLRVVK